MSCVKKTAMENRLNMNMIFDNSPKKSSQNKTNLSFEKGLASSKKEKLTGWEKVYFGMIKGSTDEFSIFEKTPMLEHSKTNFDFEEKKKINLKLEILKDTEK